MTVEELIEKLREFNPTQEVLVAADSPISPTRVVSLIEDEEGLVFLDAEAAMNFEV